MSIKKPGVYYIDEQETTCLLEGDKQLQQCYALPLPRNQTPGYLPVKWSKQKEYASELLRYAPDSAILLMNVNKAMRLNFGKLYQF